jgi:thymidylate synthase (FAD)
LSDAKDEIQVVHAPIVELWASSQLSGDGGRWLAEFGVDWDRFEEMAGGKDVSDPDAIVEAAARCCYWSYNRGRGHAEHIANLLDVGHGSVLEHATFTLAIAGISRTCSHEMVRHRHLSFSQLSQRYCGPELVRFVMPPRIHDGPDAACEAWVGRCAACLDQYRAILGTIRDHWPEAARKEVYEAARSVLPGCTETRMFVTGNGRSWRHFLALRGGVHADAEIRRLSLAIAPILKAEAPELFRDVEADAASGTVTVGKGSV